MTKNIAIKNGDTLPDTAAQKVLSTRNLVAEIIRWLVEILDHSERGNGKYHKGRGRRNSLCDLVTLNRLWFDQTIPYIWKAPTNKNSSFHQRFAKVKEARLQTYANFVEYGHLLAVPFDDLVDNNRILRGVTFPRLNQIDLVLRYRERILCFPRLSAPALQSIRIRIAWILKSRGSDKVHFRFGHGTTPRLNPQLGHRLGGCLKSYFTSVSRVVLGPGLLVHPRTVQSIGRRLPNVAVFVDDSKVVEE
ncbi:uncharacterized protein N7498_009217 [Penicillium cinerascens]|uniref:Uncharacterized protein n=1 Tax=Penicillium cinerascens TaxID=70096 RepID=A0A9W9J5I6_9EURO|nr:uncharacterized protein N7498_009217 [Penicillium cinerascens]KAJ5190232.1 hypothetical protein N7498_009217 [Penicillium cinerascens]